MYLLCGYGISFPDIGITWESVPKSFSVFGITITISGLLLILALLTGVLVMQLQVRRVGQNKEMYLDFALYAILLSIVGARVFYVIFRPSEYAGHWSGFFNVQDGGFSFYGAFLTGLLVACFYSGVRKISVGELGDICVGGLAAGRFIGIAGEFFERRALGVYTESMFAMQLDLRDVSTVFSCPYTELIIKYAGDKETLNRVLDIREQLKTVGDAVWIQVHPVFAYEMIWNLILLLVILIYTKHRKFKGELLLLYLFGYGLGNFFLETIRLERLCLWNTTIPVACLLSVTLMILSVSMWGVIRFRINRKTKQK